MPFSYLDHEADVGIEATGGSAAEALESGVQGMLEFMVDPGTVRAVRRIPVGAEGSDLGGLFVALLNAVLAQREITGQFFQKFELDSLDGEDGKLRVEGSLIGEPVDLDRHDVANEVKAATYSGPQAEERPGWVALRCLLDI